MKTFYSLALLAAMGALCSATPGDTQAPRQPTREEPAAPQGLDYGVEVGSPALPGRRALDESSRETCPKDTIACHLPRNWNCCPKTAPCCGPGCCAEGYRCVDARVGVCCPEGTTFRGGVCARVREGDYCRPTEEECGSGMVCCEGRCSRRCGGGVVVCGGAVAATGWPQGGRAGWWCTVVLLGTALANAV
ncbi:uncharacterized protein LY79DRAFT_171423 [Colletotrichum navitas]|uniref:Uncharacterized protein n=1 Tax=Colletotrichum navitas TaxID=681940 RepID=A0AAD8V4B7_9PEZI|nr:uncharacterized protein LY79DRAFT_171423 [Colletotrichum navitas]KAK1593792.1 hypothetical protein LY79DRAFT_171423 [Colletotrichum navitas]